MLLRPRSIDIGYAFSLLEQVENWELVIKKQAEVLKDRSVLVIQLPNLKYLVEPHTKFPLLGFMPKHLRKVIESRYDEG